MVYFSGRGRARFSFRPFATPSPYPVLGMKDRISLDSMRPDLSSFLSDTSYESCTSAIDVLAVMFLFN